MVCFSLKTGKNYFISHFQLKIICRDVIKKGAQAKIAAGSPVTRLIAETAFEARAFALNHGYDTPLFNALVFKKFSALVGGNLRYALSGGKYEIVSNYSLAHF